MEQKTFSNIRIMYIQMSENACRLITPYGSAHAIHKTHANYNAMVSLALTAGANDLTINVTCEVDEKDFMKGSENMGGLYEKTTVTHLTLNCMSDTKQ